ncbi:MAG: hypothetical protein R3B96_21890 [Pirellulaceae bacterium]
MSQPRRRSRAPKPPVETTIDHWLPTGEGCGSHGDREVHAWGALPGERVMVQVRKRKAGIWHGMVAEVLEASADQGEPLESHYLCCSPWQVVRPDLENGLKTALVREMASRHGVELPSFTVQGAVEVGYRNKLEFGFTGTDEGLSLSFFVRGGSGWRMPLDGCVLANEPINVVARAMVARLNQLGLSPRTTKSLILRSNRAGQVVAGLYVRDRVPTIGAFDDLEPLVGWRVYLSNPKSPASVVDETLEEYGAAAIREQLGSAGFELTDRSFFQVNVPRFETALEAMKRHVLPDRPIVDLYAGVGSIGIGLGRPGTLFVESDPQCVECLTSNCQAAGLESPTILAQPAEAGLPDFPSESTVIVDPPRVGLHAKVVRVLAERRPSRLIYLSCNPDSQLRDLSLWRDAFRVVDFEAFNFFPRTPHVESLAILEPL